MTFAVGDRVKTRDGRDARVICVDLKRSTPLIAAVGVREDVYYYESDGRYSPLKEYPNDLMPPAKRLVGWANVFPDGSAIVYPTKDSADTFIASRIACVRIDIEYHEGEGL